MRMEIQQLACMYALLCDVQLSSPMLLAPSGLRPCVLPAAQQNQLVSPVHTLPHTTQLGEEDRATSLLFCCTPRALLLCLGFSSPA